MPKSTQKRATTSARSRAKKTTLPTQEEMMPMMPPATPRKNFFSSKWFRGLLGLIVIAAVLYYFKSWFVVASVNGELIPRTEYIQALEQQSGKQVLSSLITKHLIFQEASKEHVTVSQAELDSAMNDVQKNLSAQGQTLDSALAMQGMTKSQFMDQLKIQKLVEKMLAKDITVSDKEVDDYITSNQSSLPQGVSGDQLKAQVRQQLQQQKLATKFQSWIANLQKQAKITQFINP